MDAVRHRLEYALLRLGAASLRAVSYRMALWLGWLAASASFAAAPGLRREADRRLLQVFGAECSAKRRRAIAQASWRNFLLTAVEIIRAPFMAPEWLRRAVPLDEILAVLRPLQDAKRGAVLACPHMGSWEMAGTACVKAGVPIFSIAGRQRNRLFDEYLARTRSAMGIETLIRGEGLMRSVLHRLKGGQVLALLPDVRMPTEGVRVRFLGHEANVWPGAALFARLADVPVVPVVNLRRGWTGHDVRLFPLIHPERQAERDADIQRMTQAVFDCFDEAIRAEPGQWFWHNRRWILDPIG